MNYLSVENLSKTFGDRTVLNQVSFGIEQGQKVALVGVNGSGKSTLLKILTGKETPDHGEVVYKKDIVVRHLLQNPEFTAGQTVLDAVYDAENPTHQLLKDYEKTLSRTATDDQAVHDLQKLIDAIDAANAWDIESQAKQILGKLGLHDMDAPVLNLSGGQQKRVALAGVLIQKPDLLILDEPTNHLDIDTIEWLEGYLSQAQMALILVTHDRYFLDAVTRQIIELAEGQVSTFKGSYGFYLEKKSEREASDASSVEKAKNLYRKELDWIRRQPKARGTKAKYRVDAFEQTKDKAFSASSKDKLSLNAQAQRQGKKVIEIENLGHGFASNTLFSEFSYTFKRKDRVGIVGPNGSGKTTFLNLLLGQFPPNEGEIAVGETTKFGYYRQIEPNFKEEQTIIDFAKDIAEVVSVGGGKSIPVSQFLTRFLFPPEVQYKPIGKLSGGEKRRLQLLQILITSPNFLVLDEPTNDLDLITLNTLEDYLEQFDGCLIIVSHDRYFMDKLVEHLFVFSTGTEINNFPGNYTDYRASLSVAKGTPSKPPKGEIAPAKKVSTSGNEKLSFKEKREFEHLEKNLLEAEKEKALLIQKMETTTEHEDLRELSEQLKYLNESIDANEMRWLELSEKK